MIAVSLALLNVEESRIYLFFFKCSLGCIFFLFETYEKVKNVNYLYLNPKFKSLWDMSRKTKTIPFHF